MLRFASCSARTQRFRGILQPVAQQTSIFNPSIQAYPSFPRFDPFEIHHTRSLKGTRFRLRLPAMPPKLWKAAYLARVWGLQHGGVRFSSAPQLMVSEVGLVWPVPFSQHYQQQDGEHHHDQTIVAINSAGISTYTRTRIFVQVLNARQIPQNFSIRSLNPEPKPLNPKP